MIIVLKTTYHESGFHSTSRVDVEVLPIGYDSIDEAKEKLPDIVGEINWDSVFSRNNENIGKLKTEYMQASTVELIEVLLDE